MARGVKKFRQRLCNLFDTASQVRN